MSDRESTPAAAVPVRPAATVMLLRDTPDGLEVFMLQRTHSATFARGQYVFPGGKVDDADHGETFEPICDGLNDADASTRLGVESGGLAWLVAAIRECFEEAGVLLARRRGESGVIRFAEAATAERFNHARHSVHDGEQSFAEFCATEDVVLLTDRIAFVDHWVTPIGERRRFDTRFFVAAAPDEQEPLHDDVETIASRWVRPATAIELWKSGELQMFPPTVASLEFLARHTTVESALTAAEAIGIPPMLVPRVVVDDAGRVTGVRLPGDRDYDSTPLPEFVIG